MPDTPFGFGSRHSISSPLILRPVSARAFRLRPAPFAFDTAVGLGTRSSAPLNALPSDASRHPGTRDVKVPLPSGDSSFFIQQYTCREEDGSLTLRLRTGLLPFVDGMRMCRESIRPFHSRAHADSTRCDTHSPRDGTCRFHAMRYTHAPRIFVPIPCDSIHPYAANRHVDSTLFDKPCGRRP